MIVSLLCLVLGKLDHYQQIMVLVDFHKYAEKQATQPQSGSASEADMSLEISIRRTTLTIEFNQALKMKGPVSSCTA